MAIPMKIPRKFLPFLIGHETCPIKKLEIDAPLTPLKSGYIFDAGKWILKLGRTDGAITTPDTHLYRVRKAEKVRAYIHRNKLEDHLVVPRKYICLNAKDNKFYVVAEKIDLSLCVARPASPEIEANFKNSAPLLGGQTQALAHALDTGNDQIKRSLTPIQAKALAELSFLGHTDLSYNNLYFTPDGKIAVIDTEPLKRYLKVACKSDYFFFLFGDIGSLLTQQSIAGIAKLKLYTDCPDALREVQKVEKSHVLWRMALLITKFILVNFALRFTLTIPADTSVAKALKVGFIAIAFLKSCFLLLNLESVYKLWSLSYQGLEGVLKIIDFEQKSII